MPTMTLLPNADGASSNWTAVGETGFYNCLNDDNGDTSYAESSTNGATMIIEYNNPSVAEADITSIDSVRFVAIGRSTDRRFASIVGIRFEVPTGYAEPCSFDASPSSHETINGTTRTVSPDTGIAWSYSELEGLEMKCTKNLTAEVHLTYLALEVEYTAAAVTDNATFFGANF